MDRSFLSDIEFKKDIKLKYYKKLSSPPKNNKMKSILTKLLYFIVVIGMLWFGSIYLTETIVSFCWGVDHMSMKEIKYEWNNRR